MTQTQKTVLITGANGYFGGVACNFFKNKGWKVLKATRNNNCDIFYDLDHLVYIPRIYVTNKIDVMIHAAAAHEIVCREKPYQSIFYNVAGTRATLDFAIANNIEKFVYLSTFHVFGQPNGIIDENRKPFPLNDYGLTHLQAEEYVQMYSNLKGIKTLIVRPSNFIGIPAHLDQCERWTLTPLGFVREAIENGAINLLTTGSQKRNFVSINDICSVIYNAISEMRFSLLHVPGPDTLSILDLANMVKEILETYYDKSVTVKVPYGGANETNDFEYRSIFLDSIYNPIDQVKDFLIRFTQKVLEWKK